MSMPWDKWVLDVTFSPRLPPVFCPWERDSVVVGMSFMTGRCPGELIGVWHDDGIEAAKAWVKENPNWREEYEQRPSAAGDTSSTGRRDEPGKAS